MANAATATAIVATVTVAAPLPSLAPQFVDDALFEEAVLNSTNFFRHAHNATAAVWNTTLAAYAATYVNKTDGDCTFEHSGGPYGENLAVGCSDAASCVDAWGNERSTYDFGHPAFTEETGHFTQLVWKTSTTFGCARRLCHGSSRGEKSTGWFLVCEYWPRGNIIGQFGEQVSRAVASGSGSSSSSSSSSRVGSGGSGGSGSSSSSSSSSRVGSGGSGGSGSTTKNVGMSNATGNSNASGNASSTNDNATNTDADTVSPYGHPSTLIITASLIVFALLVSAVVGDAILVLGKS